MISTRPIDRDVQERALEARGGFLWWYLDLVDGDGNGAVVIWSYGLPFLPGYAASAREDRAPRARERPSLNVAIYRDWELDCYLLREYEPSDVQADLERQAWSFDGSRIRTSRTENGRRIVAELDCDVPGSDAPLTGSITAEGVGPLLDETDREEARHCWAPRAVPAEGEVDLTVGETDNYQFQGRAYHDANSGTVPLHDLGIERWLWGRVPLEDREIVYYGLWDDDGAARPSRAFALELSSDGTIRTTRSIELELSDAAWNLGGMRWWRQLAVRPEEPDWPELDVHHRAAVDSGPFYMRYLTEVDADGYRASGVGELIRPQRIDLARHRPLVRMRVDRQPQSNSMWLPLFTGPKRGRVRRLLRHTFGGGAS